MSYETTEYLIFAAKQRGFEIVHRRISDWHRAGLLPKPDHVRLGRGSESHYPANTYVQLLALCRIIEKFPTELTHVGWHLWLEGFPVAECYWLNPFSEAAKTLTTVVDKAFEQGESEAGGPTLSIRGDKAAQKFARLAKIGRPLQLVRRRIGKRALSEVASQILLSLIGEFAPPVHDDKELAKWEDNYGRLLGSKPGSHKKKFSGSEKVTGRDLMHMLEELAPRFRSMLERATAVKSLDVDQLRALAGELDQLVTKLFLKSDFDTKIPQGRARIIELARRVFDKRKPSDHAIAILLWSAARQVPEVSKGVKLLNKVK